MIDLEKIDISNFLPHRPPFLMVDKILTLDDENVSASFKIEKDCIFIKNNQFNELGLVENAAQTCSAIVGRSYFEDDDIEGKGTKLIGFISAIKKIEVYAYPTIGNTIISKANLESRFDINGFSICALKCHIFENENKLLSCEMNLVIQELK